MGFSSKTGISLASGFKYQAQSPLDLRRAVDTITERDELVTINAAWEGMHVYVKADKKTYEYRGGTTWTPVLAGSMYIHPTYTARTSGLYKITVDGTGHISGATAVTKADITALGIPGSDTKYGVFKAATADAAGGTGLVPAPAKGAQGLFLRGDNVWAKPTDTTYNDATTSAHGLMTAADKTKLDGIASGANKYTHPATHSIDMITETTDKKVMTAAERTKLAGIAEGANKYIHPNYTARTSGLYKVTVDSTGHISAVAAVTKADITGLGIPSSDTWRGIQNNLTSTATDQSLSAAQGKWLNENKATITTLTNENLDKVTTPGFYNAGGGNSVTNKPSGVDNFGMIVVHSASGDYYTQIVYAADKSYRRVCSNGTWGNWSQDILTDTKYTHPTYNAKASGLYKVTVDGTGHVSAVAAVTKADITALGIPGQDTNTTYNDVTTSAHGLMTAADKVKLNGIAAGANNYIHPSNHALSMITETDTLKIMTADERTKLAGIEAGANKYTHPTYNAKASGLYKVTVDGTGHVSAVAAVTKADITGLGIPGSNTTYNAATTTTPGLMSAADKAKLDGIAAGANKYTYTHPNSGVTAGTYKSVTVDAQGHVTGGSNPTTLAGYGITDAAKSSHNHKASDITDNIPASKISGVLSLDNIPKAALERQVPVADDTARFKLTTDDVQNGDVVKVKSTGLMYFVTDQTKLNSADGYMEFTAGSAASVPWTGVTGKPSTFTPSSHKHAISDITSLQDALNGKAANKDMTAATANTAGAAGLVPAPAAGKQGQFLRGDGTWSTPTNTTYNDATTSTHGLMTAADKTKLDGIASGANKYVHPSYTAKASGLYKVTVDASGHVSAATAVTKADITALGIPAQDTNTTYSTGTASASGLTKLYTGTGSATDGTMTQKAITDALNGKSGTGHTHNYAGSSSAGGVANSAAKLATARTVSGGTDITMSYSYDGSANSSASIGYYSTSATNGNTNNYPFHRFAKLDNITGSYMDKTMTVLLTQDYNDGAFGIARISLRTNNVANKDISQAEVRWLVRSGFNADAIQVGIYNVAGATYADAFLKLGGTYACTVIRAIASGNRGSIARTWTLISSREVDSTTSSDPKTSTESYVNIATAGTKLHNQAYSTTVSGSDSGTTSYANGAGSASYTTKMQTYKQGSTSETYGTQYPLYAQWEDSKNVRLKCDGYTVKTSYSDNAGSATKATQDSAGQQINTTYIKGLSVSGRTITYTRGDNTTGTITTQDTNTTYADATTSAHGLMTAADKTKLNGIATGANNYSHPTNSGNKHIPSGGSAGQILRWSADGTAVWGSDNNTTYSVFKGATSSAAGGTGLVPAPATGNAGQYLRGDGTWATPTNTTYSDATTSAHGLMTAADKTKLNGIATGANNYTHPTTSGNKHIPSGGSSGQILKWSSDGTATWAAETNTWRGIQNNLTSTSTDQSLSAYQGKVLNDKFGSYTAKSNKVSATLSASSWSGSGPYTITVTVSGVTTSNNVEVLIPGSATDAQVEAWMAAGIVNGTQAANSITLKAYGDKPSINIPIECIIRKDI